MLLLKNIYFTLINLGKKAPHFEKMFNYDLSEKIFKLFVPSHFVTDFGKIWCESLHHYDVLLI